MRLLHCNQPISFSETVFFALTAAWTKSGDKGADGSSHAGFANGDPALQPVTQKNPDLRKQWHQAIRLPAARADAGKHGAVPAPAYGEAKWATDFFISC